MDADERRHSILLAARDLFRERPYDQVSITDIAEAAGVARGLLHHYFASKRELYLEVIRTVSTVVEMGDQESWSTAVDSFVTAVRTNQTAWLTSIGAAGPAHEDDVESILDGASEVLAAQTIGALGIPDDDPHLRALVRGYGGLVREITLEWLVRGRLDEDQARTILTRTLPLLVTEILPDLEA